MGDDIVKRLQAEARPKGAPGNYRDELWHEAADEIERLRDRVAYLEQERLDARYATSGGH